MLDDRQQLDSVAKDQMISRSAGASAGCLPRRWSGVSKTNQRGHTLLCVNSQTISWRWLQEEELQPFVSVLRRADSLAVQRRLLSTRLSPSLATFTVEPCSFQPQVEALKPFVSVLRLADSPAVRHRAVQAVASAITVHPRGLGSGEAVIPADANRAS